MTKDEVDALMYGHAAKDGAGCSAQACDSANAKPAPRSIETIVALLRDAKRSKRIANRRVREADLRVQGEYAHLENVSRYLMNLEAELRAAIDTGVESD